VAGRLAGAFRNIGRARIADDILESMRAAGYTIREDDPFQAQSPLGFSIRERSPYVNRIRLMWQSMREPIRKIFPVAIGKPGDIQGYMKRVSDSYVLDA